MIENRLQALWSNLQGKKPQLQHFLSEIRLDGIHGLNNLRVMFDYPVSVIAGGNATGKSTVLLAAACAYMNMRTHNQSSREFKPAKLFPTLFTEPGWRGDERQEVSMDYDFLTPEGGRSMRWRRTNSGWNMSFFGRQNTSQPERQVYLRTLGILNDPNRVDPPPVLQQSWDELKEVTLSSVQIEFAHQMLPFNYSEVINLSRGSRNTLFAIQKGGAAYSEYHMAAGERAILFLSQEITQLNGALVLIDEVEAGLHPHVQQLLMLHLQQLALRNDLQIIVTSHSPVVLDAVPSNGKIFLDRDDVSGEVVVRPPYRDIIQNALYGRLNDKLKLLCEDKIAEEFLEGIFDFLSPKDGFSRELVRIGRDTGADQFPMHAETLRKFGQIQDTVFVLDGDQRGRKLEEKIEEAAGIGVNISILFLPGKESPESWLWNRLKEIPANLVSEQLGIDQRGLISIMNRLDSIYNLASEPPSEVMKSKFRSLSDALRRDASDICRIVARLEADRPDSEIQPILNELREILKLWRG